MARAKSKKVWEPSNKMLQNTYMMNFAAFSSEKYSRNLNSWEKLYTWSISELEEFWESISFFTKIKWKDTTKKILIRQKSESFRKAKWFSGGTLNFAENLLPSPSDKIIITTYEEGCEIRRYTSSQLSYDVASAVLSLKKIGVKKNDRIAGVLSHSYEAIVSMLACTAVGAVWSSCSPDFGVDGIVDRLGQIDAKIIFFQRSYKYGGKKICCKQTILECLANESINAKAIIVYPKNQNENANDQIGMSFENFLEKGSLENHQGKIEFTFTDFDHPVYILFSSGTTGKPKAIVHGAGGTLLQHKKELMLHGNLGPSDKLCFFTTCGWMMWNWTVSALSLGTALVTFDGSPAYPDLNILWKTIENEKITAFGTSPKFLGACQQNNIRPQAEFDLSSLKTIFSTGSPLMSEQYRWIYGEVKKDVHLASISGGTDIISCFMLGNPCLPVYEGEIQCPGLGMDIHCWDQEGHELIAEKGELVCSSPFVSMPLYFLNDPDEHKYIEAYFSYFNTKDVWRHGDYCEITENGGLVIYGRSDATLNPGGVRIGTSEIYQQVEKIPEILDSVAIGLRLNGDSEIVLFVVLNFGVTWSFELEKKIKQKIRNSLTPRHIPAKIFQVKSIPYTRSGKKVELAVLKAVKGEKIENLDALQNPHSIKEFSDFSQLGQQT